MKPPVHLARPFAAFVAVAVALVGCSSGSGASSSTTTADRTAAGTSSTTTPGSTASTTASTTTSSPSPAAPAPVVKLKKKKITVTEFGHTITAHAIQRSWPWPPGYEASSATLELVAVEMTWDAGSKYTAAISPDQFTLVTGATLNRPDPTINAALNARKYVLLPAQVPSGKTATGWLVFKVDPKGAKTLVLRYDRPKALVTTTNQTIPAKTFTVKLVG